MVTLEVVRTMAAYNAEMNRRFYEAASRLPDLERKQNRGAFWRSIHETLSHLLWADLKWMSLFDGGPVPTLSLKESGSLQEDFVELKVLRFETDGRMNRWASKLDQNWLAGEISWFSGAWQRRE
jgi:uncharacterized damage-inducible protein DinB